MQIRNQLTITLCVPRRNRRVEPTIYIDFGCFHLTAGCTLKECLSSNYISFIRLSLILNTTLDILIAHKESYRCYSRRGVEGKEFAPTKVGMSAERKQRGRGAVCAWWSSGSSGHWIITLSVLLAAGGWFEIYRFSTWKVKWDSANTLMPHISQRKATSPAPGNTTQISISSNPPSPLQGLHWRSVRL